MPTLDGLETLRPARARLAGARQALAAFRPLHERAGSELERWVARNIAAAGALLEEFPSGWPPLARATLAARRRRGLGTRPLVATGRLREGVTLTVGPRAAVLDNPVPYAPRHQTGRGVPRRPFFPSAAQAERIVLPAALHHLRKALP